MGFVIIHVRGSAKDNKIIAFYRRNWNKKRKMTRGLN